ncbi:MAG TPA: hypothetical protein VJ022_07405 [Anaerolineales bacterium]|nr:hypothetical protein [Anaerolineales bacterium]
MSQLSDTGRIKSTTGRTTWLRVFVIGEETLRRISGLIQLAFGVLNGRSACVSCLIDGGQPWESLCEFGLLLNHTVPLDVPGTHPHPSFQGIEIEFFSLVAIVVYSLIGWILIQLMWILFSRMK